MHSKYKFQHPTNKELKDLQDDTSHYHHYTAMSEDAPNQHA